MKRGSKPGWDYNRLNDRWELRGKAGDLKLAISDSSQAVTGFVQVIGTSAALQSGTGTIAISSKLAGEIKFEDIIIANPGTAFPTVGGSGPVIGWVRATNDGLVNFGVLGSIGVMNWRVVAIKGERYLTNP